MYCRIAFSKLYSKLYFDLFTLSRPITIQSHSLRLQVTDILFLSTFSAPPALPSPPPVVSRDPPSPPKEFSWVKCCFKCESGYEWYELGGKGKYSTWNTWNILCSVSRNHTFDFVICNAVKFFIPSLDKDDFVKRVAKGLRVMFDATIHYPLLSHAMSMHFTRSHGISHKLTLTHCSSH